MAELPSDQSSPSLAPVVFTQSTNPKSQSLARDVSSPHATSFATLGSFVLQVCLLLTAGRRFGTVRGLLNSCNYTVGFSLIFAGMPGDTYLTN